MTVRDVDRGARVLLARMRGLREGVTVTVGVHRGDGAQAHPSGGTVGEVASLLEMGTDLRRPLGFLRNTIDEQRGVLAQRLADAGSDVLRTGASYQEAFGPMARDLAGDVRRKAPVDTGRVRESVTARVNGTRVG